MTIEPGSPAMKDAPLLRGNLAVRLLVALFGGLILFGVAIVCMLESELGLPPWDVLHYGIAKHTPLPLGTAGIVVGLIIVAITWALGTPPGFGTIANAVVIGLSIDVLSSIDAVDALSESALAIGSGSWWLGCSCSASVPRCTSARGWGRARATP